VRRLRALGIRTSLITGDNEQARAILLVLLASKMCMRVYYPPKKQR